MSDPKKRSWSRTAVALMLLAATGLVSAAAAVPAAAADATWLAPGPGHHWLTLVTRKRCSCARRLDGGR